MPRAATRRRALAAALACAAMLSACTGNSDDGPATATGDPRRRAGRRRRPPPPRPSVAAATSSLDASPAGAAAREKAFVGAALQSANAYAKTLPGSHRRGEGRRRARHDRRQGARASPAAGDTAAQMLAQTTLKKTGAAVLVLLVGGQAGAPFKAAAVTPMLPDAKLDALDPTTDGSAAVGDGTGLSAKPDDVVAAFAASVKYPDPTATKVLADDPLSEQLRQSAPAQSQALNNQGAFTQEHDAQGHHRRTAPQGRQGRHRLRPPRAQRRHRHAHARQADARPRT